jgi:hypothetical protein
VTFRIEPQLGPHPKCYRGVCTNCGRAAPGERALHSWAISLDHEDGHYGDFWLCESCLREWAQAIGMITVDQADDLRVKIALQAMDLATLRDKLKLYTALEAFLDSRGPIEPVVVGAPEPDVALVIEPDLPEGMVPYVPRGKARR